MLGGGGEVYRIERRKIESRGYAGRTLPGKRAYGKHLHLGTRKKV